MQRVAGIGGIFFKAKDPKALGLWYQNHLGINIEDWGGTVFRWVDDQTAPASGGGSTVWSPFKEDTDYFGTSQAGFMVNFRVSNLDAMLAQLREHGCEVDDKTEVSEFGKFGWVTDPEGNRVELWQPPEER